ncbi:MULTISPECIES: DNA-directed RNA polymerase subunit alpha C-terminal domain-containing protein [Chryseobacterium]|uniref:DNA-directed RNA polymerase alpha subunit n=1 Tax=Chryseobacterium camelliae TaxID=1265445 RepID=A0ABU0TF43_9FLAO|nr:MULTISPECIES: DNA-directed RNA polymerase subunit alpha C-terminal domain-containing protein [Chryseobacterium]MDT3406618.1 DNA-directed RNA polymerase alpha subunit [Pseudacidovorax intermedius]MDQ1095586.1 DNA-directed RNA polymerase alpha subunit [Chryseobacterium camelliae]MDQ1099522.1 DNA-directed RNA polymerase alpha subunit [Chryseobacterium sp. SORGH_AS_1048]MDR6086869.1 DNA-directed RNA polymerase alpha subunit [Chryseobacterium sp. SORGH_AS_0909]MDR6131241.1 DNA-directed RNA polym
MINLVLMAKCLKNVVPYHPESDFLKDILPVTARRALEREKIDSLEKLCGYSEAEILQMQGFGKYSMQRLKKYMKDHQADFRNNPGSKIKIMTELTERKGKSNVI